MNFDPNIRYYMRTHNLMQGKAITFDTADVPEGPRERETWVSTITITKVTDPGLKPCAGLSFTGQGLTKGKARDAACYLALGALGAL